ncbi:hypothetical protein BDM02DRAFT_3123471 [Thelephora ganbajun]|uniref:Uncharacterized protein n=1 Tax=Thelephora ganbajun TaxID=370292 RepID=A0ACB6Z1J3_THEGA|nr:hypothetical protein BDM02DRAFT_3123471 [Thelephora ganbajun]
MLGTLRDPTVTVHNTLPELSSRPRVISPLSLRDDRRQENYRENCGCRFRASKSRSISREKRRFSVKLKYGNKDQTTAPTKPVDDSAERTWFAFRPFLRHYLH